MKMFLAVYHGTSMNPTLLESEVIEVEPYREGSPAIGDVVFAIAPDSRKAIVHRVIAATRQGLELRGDNNDRSDERLIPPREVAGKVVAAWNGPWRRNIQGGWKGRLSHSWCLLRKRVLCPDALPFRCWFLLGEAYRRVARNSPLAGWLPCGWKPKVVAFRIGDGFRLRLMLGRHPIGTYDPEANRWHIRRPFRLIVDERDLPASRILTI